MFNDLILVYWVNHTDPGNKHRLSQEFIEFADKLDESRYFAKPNTPPCLYMVDTVSDIDSLIAEWVTRIRYSDDPIPTVWFGFQGGPGWTVPEFHDILIKLDEIKEKRSFRVEWLADNWFDHPGLTPTFHNGDHALNWMEQQIVQLDPDKINYEFKGA